jgi:hypothetical protein
MIAQPEFEGFPTAEHRPAESFAVEFARISQEKGPLVPQNVLGKALGFSPQRVHQLMASGRLEVVELAGTKFVPLDDVTSFQRLPGGRPKKVA